jgi:Gram-negative bacterial TonB protein C-terminal
MKPLRLFLSLLILAIPFAKLARAAARPEDVQVRAEAVHLLEHANLVSTSPRLPNLERMDTFLAFDLAYGTREGGFTRVVIQGTGRRDETTFGDYHAVDVWSGGRLYRTRTQPVAPPEVANMMRLAPIYLVRFDHEDVIHAIVAKEEEGRSLRCIEFDTIAGEKTDNNEICVDAASGALATFKNGNEFIENSDFFAFAGQLVPAKIRYSVGGVLKLEITQTMTELTDATPNVLEAPPNAQVLSGCTTFRRAFGQFMPQPKSGGGGAVSDVLLRGVIGINGKVQDAVVQSTERPDLSPEALTTIQQWQFTPALCNGNPVPVDASYVLHFQGR